VNKRLRYCIAGIPLAIALGALAFAVTGAGVRAAALPAPAPDLEAQAAVRLQLAALARNDDPFADAGIETAWGFASPANRETTGPLERFRTLFDSPVYAPMVDHLAARTSAARGAGGGALVGVVLTAQDGRERGYLFRLSRHDTEDCSACWMTDSVLPVPVPQDGTEAGPVI
jgi:hypothetical protein